MIKYLKGDLLRSDAQALVNAVNCQGVMGKGIAYQFRLDYPVNAHAYEALCKENKIGAGQLSVTDEHGRKVINFPTRDKWDSPSGYEFIESGLRELKALIKKQGLKSVAIPALGCGSGGLDWRQVDNLIQTHLGELTDTDIMIYPPVKYIDDSISPHHVLVWWIDNCLLIPSRYNLYIAIYILQRLNGMNLFNFSGTISTLYSDDIDRYVNDLRDRIAYYGIDFNTVIDVQIKLNRELPENPLPIFDHYLNRVMGSLNPLTYRDQSLLLAMMIDGLLQGKAIKEITTILRERYQARDIDFVLFQAKNGGLLKDNILGDVILTR
ncbi:macro domain-containing protein [Morganella morganii]|uniref:Macro domain-containing protein n=1 Tax=Morganella morganii TaxID=582 RepID=A0A9Q4CQ39_MORMO|nr:macro domain-containing protein [Morganella morganii]BEP22445.1 hypothetical protein SUGSMm_32420 [Morganella morganii subsp. sibonii]EGT3623891.1 hypothetical protein [Morganella morganii]EGT3630139.1 hypothetical protein [Morganella morganii]EGT3633460.1 hypothetical protein [Morganella morganii]EJD6039681.1 macro domain-containing protein [Morganella morganii]